jgi:chromosome segregation protein
MATLFKNFRGNSSAERELAEEMRSVLRDIQHERSRCEALVESAQHSLLRTQELGEPITAAADKMEAVAGRLTGLEQRLAAVERLAGFFQDLDDRAARLDKSQRQVEKRIGRASEESQGTLTRVEELAGKLDLATGLKEQLDAFLKLDSPFQQLRGEADQLRGQLNGTTEQFTRIKEQHGQVMDAHRLAFSKIQSFDERHQELARALQDKERRLSGMEQAIRALDGVHQSVDDAKRKLDTLKALGDYVAQRTSALESQREVVDRAISRAEHLDDAMRRLDDGLRKQQENVHALEGLREQVTAVQALHELVVEQARKVEQHRADTGETLQSTRAELAAVRDETKHAVERLYFEASGLDTISQRVADVRGALSDFETRFAGLDESKQAVDSLHLQLAELTDQLESLSAAVGHLHGEAGRTQTLRKDLDAALACARDAGERIARIEEARPALELALKDVAQLQSTHTLAKEALEQTRVAAAEISRVREEQSETRSWLAGVEAAAMALRERVDDLRKFAPNVELVQKQVQRVNESMAAIESRRDFVEDMHRRLADLGSLGATLDERGRELHVRMEAAERRFVDLAARAEEAERVGHVIGGVSSGLEAAERDVGEITRNVAALENRCETLDALAERTRSLREEIEQRQHALEQAAQDLERAGTLRQEAAASAQELEERTKRLTSALGSADRMAGRVETLAAQIQERADGLQAVDTRLDQFEERLSKWELVEQEISRSLDQLSARQRTVESLQADIDRMVVLAEKTMADVRAITSAQREIEEGRSLLDAVLAQLRELGETTSALDERKRQLGQAEVRLAQSEALLIDVRSGLGVLQGQKIIVDQAIEKAGSLQFLLKQAESMIEGLREERDITTRVRVAVASANGDGQS